jgi:hypothetical protein
MFSALATTTPTSGDLRSGVFHRTKALDKP